MRLICLTRPSKVMSGCGLLSGSMSGSMALLLSQYVLMSVTPDTTEGREDRAIQSWSCPSPCACALENRPETSHGQHSRTDPVDRASVSRSENVIMGDLTPPLICHMVALERERCPPPISLLPLTTCDRRESWHRGYGRRRVVSTSSHQ